MKSTSRLTFYAWPILAVAGMLALPVAIAFIPVKQQALSLPRPRETQVKYTAPLRPGPNKTKDFVETRALYAPDLFAAPRSVPLETDAPRLTNQADSAGAYPRNNFLFLSSPAATNDASTLLLTPGVPHLPDSADALLLTRSRAKKTGPEKKTTVLLVEVTGTARKHLPAKNLFAGLALPAGRNPCTITAEICFNAEGYPDCVFAESTDCGSALYQEIVKRLWQCRLAAGAPACAGTITISTKPPPD